MAWCVDHPTIAAAGVCPQCSGGWCTACSRRGNLHKPLCPRCGVVLGAPPVGGGGEVIGRLFSKESLIAAVTVGLLGIVIEFIGTSPGVGIAFWLFYIGAIVSYYFNIIQHVGGGAPGMPGATEVFEDILTILSRGGRGILCLLVSLAPLLVWLFGLHHARDERVSGTTVVTLLVAGQLYMPAVLLSVTFGDSAWNALWPPAWISVISRAPGPYAWFSGLWLVTVIVGGIVVGVLESAAAAVPYVGVVIAATISMLFWWLQAVLVGRFIRQNAEAFGWDGP